MPERLLQFVPFLAGVQDGSGKFRPKLNTARILEIIILIVVVIYSMKTSLAVVETKVDNLSLQVATLNTQFINHIDKVVK